MTGIDWVAFLPAALLVSLVPGANQLLSLRNAVRQGTGDATVALLGRFSAFAVLITVVALGFGAVLVQSAVAFTVLKWAGVAYLTWLGMVTLWRARRGHPPTAAERVASRGRWALTRQEFTVALTNPKALLLFAAFVPQFVRTPTPDGGQLAVLGFAYIGIEAVSALGYTLLGGRLNGLDLTGRVQRRLDRLCGSSFLGLAGYLGAQQQP